jgi:hypothetical protein
LDETNRQVEKNRDRFQNLSDEMETKEQECNDQHSLYTKVTDDVQQRQATKANLDGRIQNLHDTWVSKRMWMTNATKNIADLRKKIGNIKLKRQEEGLAKFKQQREQEASLNNSRTMNNLQNRHQMNYKKS